MSTIRIPFKIRVLDISFLRRFLPNIQPRRYNLELQLSFLPLDQTLAKFLTGNTNFLI